MNNKQQHDQMILETRGFLYMGKAFFELVFLINPLKQQLKNQEA
jgi:hypothetical protein